MRNNNKTMKEEKNADRDDTENLELAEYLTIFPNTLLSAKQQFVSYNWCFQI